MKVILSSGLELLKILFRLACFVVLCMVLLTELPPPLGIGIIVALFMEGMSRAGKMKA